MRYRYKPPVWAVLTCFIVLVLLALDVIGYTSFIGYTNNAGGRFLIGGKKWSRRAQHSLFTLPRLKAPIACWRERNSTASIIPYLFDENMERKAGWTHCKTFDYSKNVNESLSWPVSENDTLDRVAKRFDISEQELKFHNDLTGWLLPPYIVIPSLATLNQRATELWESGLLRLHANQLSPNHTCPILSPHNGINRGTFCFLPAAEGPLCSSDHLPFSEVVNSSMLIFLNDKCGAESRRSFAVSSDKEELALFRGESNHFNISNAYSGKFHAYFGAKVPLPPGASVIWAKCNDSYNLHLRFVESNSDDDTGSLSESSSGEDAEQKPEVLVVEVDVDEERPIRAQGKQAKLQRPGIALIMLDTVSRAHFVRSFPRTVALMEDLHTCNVSKLYQYFLYNVVSRGTNNNFGSLMAGSPVNHAIPNEAYHTWLWLIAKRLGYTTAAISEVFKSEVMRWWRDGELDYNMHHPFNADLVKEHFANLGARLRICLTHRDACDYALQYMREFHTTLKARPRLSLLHLQAGHDRSMRAVRAYDNYLHDTLRVFADQNLLENTIVVFVGDHGQQAGLFFSSQMGSAEYRNPVLNIMIPPKLLGRMTEQERQNLYTNQWRLSTPYDLHRTLFHFMQYPYVPPRPMLGPIEKLSELLFPAKPFHLTGNVQDFNPNFEMGRPISRSFSASFMHEEILPSRTCGEANIPSWWCACAEVAATDVPSEAETLRAVNATIAHLAKETAAGNCAALSSGAIKSAEFQQYSVQIDVGNVGQSGNTNRRTIKFITLLFETVPFAQWYSRVSTSDYSVLAVNRITGYIDETCDKGKVSRELCMCPAPH